MVEPHAAPPWASGVNIDLVWGIAVGEEPQSVGQLAAAADGEGVQSPRTQSTGAGSTVLPADDFTAGHAGNLQLIVCCGRGFTQLLPP